ncbi:signal peptidase I [Crossiella equi]|uniref:Signal peptidase I n=1 Tax=Crossiella equi TaxID=130796 RepID=A0ABS5ALY7_9PSEU|nr:signal peptidase I [Crossiella equi]MBP2476710.1 signal peptidase I [Crossiella equi]
MTGTKTTAETGQEPARRGLAWGPPVLAAVLGLLLLFVGIGALRTRYDSFAMVSTSMANGLPQGARTFTSPVTDGGASVQRGDVVLFDAGSWPGAERGEQLVKRVVGIGGDVVSCCDAQGRLQVNGRSITEPYLRLDDPRTGGPYRQQPFTVRVPQDSVLLLGDYRGNSRDSRSFLDTPDKGAIPRSAIKSVVVVAFGLGDGLRQISPNPAFTDAGLAGGGEVDRGYRYAFWLVVGGGALALVSLVWLAVVGGLRALRRRRRQVLPVSP